VVQSWAGLICPLTTLEMWLRGQSGGVQYNSSFIAVSGPIDTAVRVTTGHNDRIRNMEEFTDAACELLNDVLSR